MNSILVTLHSYNRYLILAALVFVLYRSISGWLGKKPFENADDKASLALLIVTHLQLLLGLLLYAFYSNWTQTAFANWEVAKKDPMMRYFAVEHITAMLIAVVLIQLGRTFSKKAAPEDKHRKLATYTGIATLIIVATLAQKGLLIGSLAAQ
ncbi:MAG: cytochrome B [Bacteroidota bacterium]